MGRLWLAGIATLLFLFGCISPPPGSTAVTHRRETHSRSPNFLLIVTDNQNYGTVEGFMRHTWAHVFQEGVSFANAYVTTPNCCPSRASILTGMYAHNHGVRVNEDPLYKATFVHRLHDAGYFTGLVGKYLNSWNGSARPEFDFWTAFAGGWSRYFNPRLNVNGNWRVQQGYITHILRDSALRFLKQADQKDQPFLLIFTPNAPAEAPGPVPFNPKANPFLTGAAVAPAPAPGDEGLYPDLQLHRPPSYNEEDTSDKPWYRRGLARLTPELLARIDTFRRGQLQSLKAVDDAIAAMLDLLQRQGKLDNTVVFFISDNGLALGEHRIWAASVVYEPAIHVPFALRYPRLVPRGRAEARLVANIDIAPTIYQLASLPIPPEVDGRSLIPLLTDAGSWREELLIEAWMLGRPYVAVHTSRYVYVDNKGDRAELYDLQIDPYQLDNRADDPAYVPIVGEMKGRLRHLLSASRVKTTVKE